MLVATTADTAGSFFAIGLIVFCIAIYAGIIYGIDKLTVNGKCKRWRAEIDEMRARLNSDQLNYVDGQVRPLIKNPITAFWWCFLLGGFGAHQFYLGNKTAGWICLLLCWSGAPGIWALIMSFYIIPHVRMRNLEFERHALSGVVAASMGNTMQMQNRIQPMMYDVK
jgi:hypothetical protein